MRKGYGLAALLTVMVAILIAQSQARTGATFGEVIALSQPVPCTELDYTGNPGSPASLILRCQDGDTVTIDAPFDRQLFVKSMNGGHSVYNVAVTDDGDYRVWYDDSLAVHEPNAVVTVTKVTGRNFSQSTASWSQGWK